MRSVITDSAVLPATAERLFTMYLDPAAHAGVTGNPVKIAAASGARFEAFGGALSGKILQVVTPHLIVRHGAPPNSSQKISTQKISTQKILTRRLFSLLPLRATKVASIWCILTYRSTTWTGSPRVGESSTGSRGESFCREQSSIA